MKSKQALVPKLRFGEFEDGWTIQNFSKVLNLISGQHLSPKEYNTEVQGIPYFTGPSDFTNNIDHVKKWTTLSTKKANKGSILITVKGSGVGQHMYLNLSEVAMGRQLMALESSTTSTELVFHILPNYQPQFEKLASGNMIPGLSRTDILTSKVTLPSLPEQEKIAAFLTSVDDRIDQLKRKKSLLQDYKKGAMQKLFSQELRFKDEQGNDFPDWKVKKLGEVCRVKKGSQLNKEHLEDSGAYPAINGGVSPSGFTDNFNSKANTITISEGGNSCGFVNYIKTRFWSGGHCYSLEDLGSMIRNDFLFQILKFSERRIMALRVGSGLPNIQKKDINNAPVILPSLPEQTKIANFLSSLDQKIEQIDTQITQTQTFKKGLLQQMFV